MVSRLDHVKPALNIVHVYGQTEGRAGQHKVLEGVKEILKELGNIEARNEFALVLGDLNRAVGNGELGVKGNTDKVSYGGQLVRELIGAGDYVLLNNLSLAEGGPLTPVCPATGRGSCLDLAIGSRDLVQFITKLQVDSKKVNTPGRAVAKKGALGLTYADHYPLWLELQMPRAEPAGRLPADWNLSKPGGWKKYEEESEKVADLIEMLADDKECSSEETMAKKNKYKAFGKTKPMTTRKVETKEKEQNAPEDKQAKEILKRQSNRMEAEITKIKAMKQGRSSNVFKMREIVAGKRKSKQEAHAIKDDETNEVVVSNEEIKKVRLNYFFTVLKNNEPEEAFKEIKELKEKVHKLRLEDIYEDEELDISEDDCAGLRQRKDQCTSSY